MVYTLGQCSPQCSSRVEWTLIMEHYVSRNCLEGFLVYKPIELYIYGPLVHDNENERVQDS